MKIEKQQIALLIVLFLILLVAFTANGLYQKTAGELKIAKARLQEVESTKKVTAPKSEIAEKRESNQQEIELERLDALLADRISAFDALQFEATRSIEHATTTSYGTWAIVHRSGYGSTEDKEVWFAGKDRSPHLLYSYQVGECGDLAWDILKDGSVNINHKESPCEAYVRWWRGQFDAHGNLRFFTTIRSQSSTLELFLRGSTYSVTMLFKPACTGSDSDWPSDAVPPKTKLQSLQLTKDGQIIKTLPLKQQPFDCSGAYGGSWIDPGIVNPAAIEYRDGAIVFLLPNGQIGRLAFDAKKEDIHLSVQ